ncbi:MAG: xanthine dehydrogenase family protein subunit M, partial [Acholeplasmataceae bacterium]|nr:xanthine dehydrogenase family protein subunit M [Acholeplasmataceae bacterium]
INSLEDGVLRIGASSTLTSIMESGIIRSKYKILVETADNMASVQVRNRATIGGNLCNASPSADMAPPLIALDAQAIVENSHSKRKINLESFFLGPGEVDILPAEILTEIHLPPIPNRSGSVYLKQKRNALDLALVGVAVQLVLNEDETCASAKIVLGAVGPTPIVACEASSILSNTKLNKHSIEKAAAVAAEEAKPIDDIRTSAWYRRWMVKVLTARAIHIANKRAVQSFASNGGGL